MNKIQLLECMEDILSEETEQYKCIDNFRKYQIAIYGAGSIGRKVYIEMKNLGLNVICFLDRNATYGKFVFDKPVYKVENHVFSNIQKRGLVVALAINTHIIGKDQIVRYLKSLGYTNIISAYSLIMPHISTCKHSSMRDIENKEKLLKAAVCFEDQHSNEIYYKNISAHYYADYENTIKSEGTVQYFNVNVPFSKGYYKFVDIGAYDGDSLKKLMEFYDCDKYIAFEPEKSNFELLAKVADDYRERINEIFLVPCAVGNENAFMSFSTPTTMGGNIAENGESKVQVVRLDDVLKCDVSMIKMDIEGAEITAIEGAKHLITRYKPDLAICIYHFISDIWEIPLILQKLVPEYKFYLRTHEDFSMETVLYATVK
ncbi:FkbM family methyltransferase [Aminipila terrae]|uniref:FkbM family methyltransferase n=1 Tax=Aminipila terrae TaxID=2697030 RepID=A0A6P1MLS7_9FIRM|nr:FkbM family methyltransferase [Aminipila terrae]QHI71945.1 FkbM family methyltransferase [Aminipila terrae]